MALEAGIWLAEHALMVVRIGDMIGCLARRSVQDECRKTTSSVVQVNGSISGVVEAPGMRVVIETGSFAATLHDTAVGPE